ncbi:NAD(P)-dependent oxidoreductase [Pseudenhygromyxa sp. WMMC2535]|uniref:NAD(P)-dependent oxidoreductase n=1 Tax=Pseudenhygromyxa sp. WMMC2535 TaxID=2712867 RepID=UPI001557C7CC|nr:NAD(P)-dependent oxidoreductase [Pseudenhygromyxa sp. WMMC2535]NVB42105.1 NAD(P)-dependent oxidoreductase [Pseudenhygromyxa sp. WMMC2535]
MSEHEIGTIAFLGAGTMGAGMIRNLASAGFEVVVYNRTREKAEDLAHACGVEIADEPVFAARGAAVIICCLSGDKATWEVLLGESGALAGTSPGALVIDCGTTSLELTAKLAAACEHEGLGFLDAPITGSKLGAESGQLTFMVGGDESDLDRAAPLFTAMGKHTVHVGDQIGDGQRAKYCLNMTQAVVLQGVLEGYTLAKLLDIPLAKVAEIFEHSAGKTGVGSFKTPYLLAGDFDPHFRLDLMHKDLHLALAQAEAQRVPLAAATTVRGLYDQAVAEGLGPRDFLAMATLLERWSGLELRE